MNLCKDCGAPLDANGLTNCGGPDQPCERDRTKFHAEVAQMRESLNPAIVERMAKNEMPECFATSRPLLVAMAQLLEAALDQLEQFAANATKH